MSEQKRRIPDAQEVVIRLEERIDWRLFDAWYREWQDKPDRPDYSELGKKKASFMISASRRAVRQMELKGEVMARGHRGKLSYDIFYDLKSDSRHHNYVVISTRPDAEVRVVENTMLAITNPSEATNDERTASEKQ